MNPIQLVNPLSILLVTLGGALGCVARFLVIGQISRLHASSYPVGTLAVNIVGSLLLGYMLTRFGHEQSARAFVGTGVLGGFTTFSAFSWDALQLLMRGAYVSAALYVGASVLVSIAAVGVGVLLAR